MKSIKSKCVICRKLDKRVIEQVMGNLPTDRLKPAPPWYSTGIDLFGPYRIRDEVKKRTTSKTYGVIFTCLGTRAVYLDIAADYSADKFLMVLRRFVSLHGYPSKLFSDNGTQLVAANKELSNITKDIEISHKLNRKVVKPSTVKFQNHKVKSRLYKARTKLKNVRVSDKFPFSTAVASERIYLNENLTSYRRELLMQANQKRKDGLLVSVWSRTGKYSSKLLQMADRSECTTKMT